LTIKSIRAYPENLKLIEPYSISISTQYEANYVIVAIRDDKENMGFGEASPLPAYQDETQQSILETINNTLAPPLLGFDEFRVLGIIDRMDETLSRSLMAKSAIEMAVHDLVSKKLNTSIIRYLGGPVREFVEVAGSIGFLPVRKASTKVESLVRQGVTTMKVKIGKGIDQDMELVGAVRSTGGKEVQIRLDANQAYETEKAIQYFKKLETFEPELFEQPVNKSDIEGMSRIVKEIDTPIMADEPIITTTDVVRYAQAEAADLVKVKLNRCGGLRKTLAVSELAKSYDLRVVIGSGHESSVGVAAESALALTGTNFHQVGEMNGNQRLAEELVDNPLLPKSGKIIPWTSPGLGINLHDSRLML